MLSIISYFIGAYISYKLITFLNSSLGYELSFKERLLVSATSWVGVSFLSLVLVFVLIYLYTIFKLFQNIDNSNNKITFIDFIKNRIKQNDLLIKSQSK